MTSLCSTSSPPSSIRYYADRKLTDQPMTSLVERPGSGSCRSLHSSTPVIRPISKTNEQSLGCVFLVVGQETRRATLPNELTHIDTVRALFINTFRNRLSMTSFHCRLIYILDRTTGVFYELDDLQEVKDGSVLKTHRVFDQWQDSHFDSQNISSAPAGREFAFNSAATTTFSAATELKKCRSPTESPQSNTTWRRQSVSPPSIISSSFNSSPLPAMNQHCITVNRFCSSHPVHSQPDILVTGYCACSKKDTFDGGRRQSDKVQESNCTSSSFTTELRDSLGRMECQLLTMSTCLHSLFSPTITQNNFSNNNAAMENVIRALHRDVISARKEHVCLRRLYLNSVNKTKLMMSDISRRLLCLSSATLRQLVFSVDYSIFNVRHGLSSAHNDLSDLEVMINATLSDVTGRRHRVLFKDIELLALVLSRVTWSLADIKDDLCVIDAKLRAIFDANPKAKSAFESRLKIENRCIDDLVLWSRKLMIKLTTKKKKVPTATLR